MHLLAGDTERIDDGDAAVDLDQSPGDIVILSAADSELAALAAVARGRASETTIRFANLGRLSHPLSVDLYVEKTLSAARLVVVRLMGGHGYWPYGIERLRALARGGGPRLVVVPGEDSWDAHLEAFSTGSTEDARVVWRYLVEGGEENCRRALGFLDHLIGRGERPPPPLVLAHAGCYWPGAGEIGKDELIQRLVPGLPAAAIIFYRALVLGNSTAPIDALIAELADAGLDVLPVFVTSLKDRQSAEFLDDIFAAVPPAIVLNTTSFAVSGLGATHSGTVLDRPGRPVLQVVLAGSSEEAWQESTRGFGPRDLTMNVVLPEVDGRVLTRAVSFKADMPLDAQGRSRGTTYRPVADRVRFVAAQAAAWVRLANKAAKDRRIAIVLSNYPDRDGRLANGVGLDTPESAARIGAAFREGGYEVSGFPASGADLMARLLAGPTNAKGGEGGERLSLADYCRFFDALPEPVRASLTARWGAPKDDPFFEGGAFRLAVHRFGNVVVGIQPARGYGVDPKATYHDPDLVPPHHYLAFYAWLRRAFDTDAMVHLGKHGNLEWLPGKALGLSEICWPEVALGATPLVYPFIVNDPGEGSQAKRRASAVIVDHLMPAMTRAEIHGPLAELETLIDEYYVAAGVDKRRRDYLAGEALALAERHGLDRDLGFSRGEDGEALRALDAHLCELKELQIRDGLHILGASPVDRQRIDTLVAIARVPRSGGRPEDASLHRAIADDLDLDFDPLDCDAASDWRGPRPDELARLSDAPWRSAGDTVERIEVLAANLVGGVCQAKIVTPAKAGVQAVARRVGDLRMDSGLRRNDDRGTRQDWENTQAVLEWIASDLAPALDRSGDREIGSVLTALDGRFVPPGPSGAPTRGRPDVLPTGRNFYSVDVRGVPTAAAWTLGKAAAEALVLRYFQDEGEWPRSIAFSAWATSNMRTGGDDVAQVMALIGAQPVWEKGTGRVTGFRVMSLSELGRPRIDVTMKISGMFRDAFPGQIDLIDSAIRAVADLDENAAANPIADATRRTGDATRIFGAKPGAYGAGMQALIDEGVWDTRKDFANAFVAWGGFAYGAGLQGEAAAERLTERLAATDAVFQAQDNREHDILDSDDYYQFMGGLAATVEILKGTAPRIYHGDHARPEKPVVRALGEEIARVVRGRAANPKWIAGMMRHGYKGAFEMAATVDYLFAFAAMTNAVQNHHFDQLYDAYIADQAVSGFIAEVNAPVLAEMAARFREAIDRGLWAPRLNSAYDRLSALIDARREAAE